MGAEADVELGVTPAVSPSSIEHVEESAAGTAEFAGLRVLGCLARRGSASVFVALRPGADGPERLCLKILRPEHGHDEELVGAFLDEARIGLLVEHPSCPRVHGYGQLGAYHYFLQELVVGATLLQVVNDAAAVSRTLPPSFVLRVVLHVAEALHHAHELRGPDGQAYELIHRDVSPDNVLVGADGRARLADFGVVRFNAASRQTATGIVKGKFRYMSPEQIRGGRIDRRSDLFALGATLHEALTGRALFRGDSPYQIAQHILDGPRAWPSELAAGVPKSIDAICKRALNPEVGRRYQDAIELAEDLRRALDELEPGAPETWTLDELGAAARPRLERRQLAAQAILTADAALAVHLAELGAGPVIPGELDPPAAPSEPGRERTWWIDAALRPTAPKTLVPRDVTNPRDTPAAALPTEEGPRAAPPELDTLDAADRDEGLPPAEASTRWNVTTLPDDEAVESAVDDVRPRSARAFTEVRRYLDLHSAPVVETRRETAPRATPIPRALPSFPSSPPPDPEALVADRSDVATAVAPAPRRVTSSPAPPPPAPAPNLAVFAAGILLGVLIGVGTTLAVFAAIR